MSRTPRQRTLVLFEDHTRLMNELRDLLRPHFEILRTAKNPEELVTAARVAQPDLVILDVLTPDPVAIEAILHVQRLIPDAKLVVLTPSADARAAALSIRAGAKGYVLKQHQAAELVNALEQVLRGGIYVPPLLSHKGPSRPSQEAPAPRHLKLTQRELQVLRLVAEGKSGKEIAAMLEISPKTVAFHKTHVMRKTGVHTIAGLTKYAIQLGIVRE
jgi:DNA-binding NarL/FixJ family response regulator